jgi:hypothetical protein
VRIEAASVRRQAIRFGQRRGNTVGPQAMHMTIRMPFSGDNVGLAYPGWLQSITLRKRHVPRGQTLCTCNTTSENGTPQR